MRERLWLFIVFLFLAGCASQYFQEAGTPPPTSRHRLDTWPYREYWQGIIFNGSRIGFSHLTLKPAADTPGQYEIHADAAFALRMFGIEKKITLKAIDRVSADLALVRFDYDFSLDGNHRRVRGVVRNGSLETSVHANGSEESERFALSGPVYPMNVLSMYPLYMGLAIGQERRYRVFDGELMKLAEVSQRVEAYETSELFSGPAFKVRTDVHGHTTRTWFNSRGLPVFELALNGVLISALEDERRARRYLAQASLNKQEVLLEFSRVPVNRPIPNPRMLRQLEIAFTGLDINHLPAANDGGQRCVAEGSEVRCLVRRIKVNDRETAPRGTDRNRYLEPTLAAPSTAPVIRETALHISAGASDDFERAARLVTWLQKNIERQAVDVFTALDVLEKRKAECQGHAYLYAAFARSLGIPTRVVNGLVYTDEGNGFFYHTWNESLIGPGWLPVDATFGQLGVDATHVKLVEGETSADLLPLLDVIGRIRARVIAFGGTGN